VSCSFHSYGFHSREQVDVRLKLTEDCHKEIMANTLKDCLFNGFVWARIV
jgi:hypothetical protein